jgi:hypothetical protein
VTGAGYRSTQAQRRFQEVVDHSFCVSAEVTVSSCPPGDFSFLNSGADKSPFPIPKIQSAFHLHAQRNTFLRRDARQQSRLFGHYDALLDAKTDGKVLTNFDHSTDIANAVAVQADGKLVICRDNLYQQ